MYVQRFQQSLGASIPNLPGTVSNKDTWTHRQIEGFKKVRYDPNAMLRPKTAGARSSTANLNQYDTMQISASQQEFSQYNSNQNFNTAAFSTQNLNQTNNQRPSTAGPLGRTIELNNTLMACDSQKTITSPIRRPGSSTNLCNKTREIPELQRPKTASLMEGRRALSQTDRIGLGVEKPIALDRSQPQLPIYIENEKQVCRFHGHFSNDRDWDEIALLGFPAIEDKVTRLVTIFYYLVDQTVEISENKVQNTGIKGGAFYKRNSLLKTDKTPLELIDLAPGNIVSVLGQHILITDADVYTREYFRRNLNMMLPPAITRPKDIRIDIGAQYATGLGPKTVENTSGKRGVKSHDFNDKKEQFDKTFQFLKFDGKVLRFSVIEVPTNTIINNNSFMDSINGAIKTSFIPLKSNPLFSLSYFLSDNKMEMRKVKKIGDDSTAKLILKKTKIPKNWKEAQRGLAPQFFQVEDLKSGGLIDVYGRFFMLIDCDNFTKSVYEEMGIDQIPQQLLDVEEQKIIHPIPQLGDGFLPIGGPEDTLATVYGFPKPSRDLVKLQRNQNRILRCKTKIISKNPVIATRNFMLSYYLEDDTLQVYEEVLRNSGIGGGNFLKRGRYTNDLPLDSSVPRYFQPQDIYLGNIISLNGTDMRITEMDNMSLRFCETYPDEFPMFDTFRIVGSLLNNDVGDIRAKCKAFDTSNKGKMTKEDIVKALDSIGLTRDLNDQELLTVLRRVKNGEYYMYNELCDLFSHTKCIQNKEPNIRPKAVHQNKNLVDFFIISRMKTTQFRRVFRKDLHTYDSYITLALLSKLFKFQGISFSSKEKEAIIKEFSIPHKQAMPLLPLLNKVYEKDLLMQKHGGGVHAARADLKSSAKASDDISNKRSNFMSTSLMRPGSVRVEKSDDTQTSDSNIVINFEKLCDSIYICDW